MLLGPTLQLPCWEAEPVSAPVATVPASQGVCWGAGDQTGMQEAGVRVLEGIFWRAGLVRWERRLSLVC